MLLTIHNLPSSSRYSDVKSLLLEKCGLTDLILDNLVSEGKMKRVTVGLADEGDAAILVRKINGLYINGQQLYVEDKRKKGDLDQPYRSSASMTETPQYQEAMVPPPVMDNPMMATMNNPMMMNYNMMGMYMPMTMDQTMPYNMAFGVPQVMSSAEFVPGAPIQNERGFQGERNRQGRPDLPQDRVRDGPQDMPWDRQGQRGGPQDRSRDGPQGRPRDAPQGRNRDGPQGRDRDGPPGRNRDRNRRHSPERPSESFNRSRRDENPAPRFPTRREKSPPRQSRAPPEMGLGPRAPFRPPERPGLEPQYQPRQAEPEFRRTDPQWEDPSPRASRWQPEPEHMSEPNQQWPRAGPSQNFEPEQARPWVQPDMPLEEPNQPWEQQVNRPDAGYPRPDRFEPNQQRFGDDYPPDQFRDEPEFREPAYHEDLEFRRREPEFRRPEPEFQMLDRPEPGFSNDRERRPRQDAPWNKGNDSRDRNYAPKDRGDRREDRFIPHGRPDRPPRLSGPKGNERRDERPLNPKRPLSDNARAPDKWSQISNDYPASKKPRGILETHAPRNKPLLSVPDNRNIRPPFKPGPGPRPAAPVVKQFTMKSLVNKDQTSRGQATAVLSKEIITTLDLTRPDNRQLLKEVKNCIRGRIDVLLGEQLSASCDDVVQRYRKKYSKEKDQDFYNALREKVEAERKSTEATEQNNKQNEEVKEEATVKDEVIIIDSDPGTSDKPIGVQIQQLDSRLNELAKKAPNRPLTDKQIISAQKRQSKLEFTKKDLFQLDPIMDQVLNEELNKLNDILQSECDNPKDESDRKICEQISKHSAEEFKSDPPTGNDNINVNFRIKRKRKKNRKRSKIRKNRGHKVGDTRLPRYAKKSQVKKEDLGMKAQSRRNASDGVGGDNPGTGEVGSGTRGYRNTRGRLKSRVLRLHLTKRILNITSGLPVRIFSEGKLPRKEAIKQFLLSYRVERLVLKKNKKGTMYIANLSNYEEYDSLCKLEHVMIEGTPVIFRSMNLLGPPLKMSRNQLLQRRKQLLERQPFDQDMLEDFTDDVDEDNFREEDLEDF